MIFMGCNQEGKTENDAAVGITAANMVSSPQSRMRDAAASAGVWTTTTPQILDPGVHSPTLVQQHGCGYLW